MTTMKIEHLAALSRLEETLADASRRRLATGARTPAPPKPERHSHPTEIKRVAPLPDRPGSR
jgi:hypothetical protein